jgi:response regulator NasT
MDRLPAAPDDGDGGRSVGIFAAAAKVRNLEQPEEAQTLVVVGGNESALMERAIALGIAHRVVRAETLEEAIALALKQTQELERLQASTTRLAQIERAKGILMERHKVSERDAHEQIRSHARKHNLKLTAVAEAVEQSYVLLPLEDS